MDGGVRADIVLGVSLGSLLLPRWQVSSGLKML